MAFKNLKYNRFSGQYLIVPIVFAVILACISGVSAKNEDKEWDKKANIRKAAAIYLQSAIAESESRPDESHSLIDYAFMLDSTDLDIAAKWGYANITLHPMGSEKFEKAYNKIKERFLASPEDYEEALMFAGITMKSHKFDDEVQAFSIIDSLNPSKTDPALFLANAYMHKYILGDTSAYNRALQIYNRIESGTGKDVGLSSMKIRAYALKKDTAAIVSELESLYKSAPNDPQVNMFLGDNFSMLSMPDSALIYLNRTCEIDSTNGAAYLARAEFYSSIGDSISYDREVFRALKSPNLEFESKFKILKNYISLLYTNPDQQPRIENLFNVLEEQHPGETELHMLYGFYLYSQNDYNRAAEQFSYATDLEPNNHEAWTAQVDMYRFAENYDKIISVASSAMDRFPDDLFFPVTATAATIQKDDDYNKALEILKKVNIREINNPTGVSNFVCYRANIYSRLDSINQAYDDYDYAIKLDPENYLAMNNYAFLLAEHNQKLEAAERLSNLALKSKPESPVYLDTYAWVLFKREQYDLAKYYIDLILKKMTHIDPIGELFPDIIQTSQSDEEPDSTLNIDEQDEGDDVDEIIEVNEPIDDDIANMTSNYEIFDHAGDIYFMNGEQAKALLLWKKALDLAPDNELIKRKVKHKTYFAE